MYKNAVKGVFMIVVELEDLPFTTPDYISSLASWMPRLYSTHRKGPAIKDDDTSWNDYSYEPLEEVKPSSTNSMFS